MASNSTDTPVSSDFATSQLLPSSSFVPPASTSVAPPSFSVPPSSVGPSSPEVPPQQSSVVFVTSFTTEVPPSTGGAESPSIVILTSTAPAPPRPTYSSTSSSAAGSSSSSSAAALATSNADTATKSSGLSQQGKIAVAVVVPIVVIALLVVGLLFFWKKRKARHSAEEQRKKEMEEYGFNPNNNPSLAPVGAAYGENKSEDAEEGVGYRGWGTTNSTTTRQPSTNMGSGRGAVGLALSDGGSNGGGHGYQTSPSNGTEPPSDGHSADPLVGYSGGRPTTGNSDLGALGGAPAAGMARHDRGMNRGPSNASSAYSTGPARSEVSEDGPLPGGGSTGPYYHEDSPYYNDGPGPAGMYGDNSSGGGQPVIRDVQAKRNTRIEKPAVSPPQGNSGIAQNF